MPASAHAETQRQTAPSARPSPARRAAAAGALLVPGALVHGAGHFVLGQPQAGWTLLAAQAGGLGMIAAGGSVIVLTGASRHLVGPGALVTILGVGLFATSFLADVHGTTGLASATGEPLVTSPWLESSLGYRYVYDPQFDYRHFSVFTWDVRWGRLRLAPSAWLSAHHPNARYRALLGWRLVGPLAAPAAPERVAEDGSFVDVNTAFTEHRYDPDRFALSTVEVSVAARYDLGRIAPSLRGGFVEGEAGYASQRTRYELTRPAADVRSLLLARFAYGLYLGGPFARGSEARLYYDHRHDDFAAGLKMTGLGSGVAGHFGADARVYLDSRWGILGEVQIGSALVTGVCVLYREGVEP